MTVIPIGAFGIVTKGLVQGLDNKKACGDQTTELSRSTRIPRRVMET